SLTTTPMMCARLLRDKEHGRLYQASERVFARVLRAYDRSLTWVLRHSLLTLFVFFVTLGLNVYLYIVLPKGFFPEQDTGRMSGTVIGDQDLSFTAMSTKLQRLAGIVQADPAVDTVVAFTGGGGGTTTNTARMFISLKPLAVRKVSVERVIDRLRPKLARVPGASLFLQANQDVRIGGRRSAAEYQYTLQSDNLDELNHWGAVLLKTMHGLPAITDANSDAQNRGLAVNLTIDRATASRLGITPKAVDAVLYDAFGEREIARTYASTNQYFVVMEVAPDFWQSPQALNRIYVASASGGMVPLAAFTKYQVSTAALAVNHSGVFPSVTLSFNLAPGRALGDAVAAIGAAERAAGMPGTVTGYFSGTAQAFTESLSNEWLLVAAAIAAVYIVLGILYESTIHPVTILSTLPSAGLGALLALAVTRTQFTIIALIGIILLIGIVKKNAILMIDFAIDVERRERRRPMDAVHQACLLRFRPILMTTMAALLGGLPLALGTGTGSELRRPLGISIVGGLMLSQAMTLYTTPVIYLYMDRLRLRVLRLFGRSAPESPGEIDAVPVR
ncbi:MAG: efflux RND transporter permease subunit, partial [Opitutaceae bacterium]